MTLAQVQSSLRKCRKLAVHPYDGPGDTLRLMHAVRMLQAEGRLNLPLVMLTTRVGFARGIGLFTGRRISPAYEGADFKVAEENGFVWVGSTAPFASGGNLELKQCLDYFGLEAAQFEQPLVHVYLGNGMPTDLRGAVRIGSTQFKRERIDTSTTMCTRRFAPYYKKVNLSTPLRVLYVIRKHDSNEVERNTPVEHVKMAQRVANELGLIVDFAGLPANEGFAKFGLNHDRCIEHQQFETYLDQITYYSEYDLAVGINSGGLDLALAAGLPCLRDFDFPGVGPHWNKWRPKYNWYLSNALNVGLLPRESNLKPTPGEDLDRFARSLREIVGLAKANPHAVLTSRYVRLPAGVSFEAESHAALFGRYSCEPSCHRLNQKKSATL